MKFFILKLNFSLTLRIIVSLALVSLLMHPYILGGSHIHRYCILWAYYPFFILATPTPSPISISSTSVSQSTGNSNFNVFSLFPVYWEQRFEIFTFFGYFQSTGNSGCQKKKKKKKKKKRGISFYLRFA